MSFSESAVFIGWQFINEVWLFTLCCTAKNTQNLKPVDEQQ